MIGYFKGCLRDIQLNNNRVHFLDPDEPQAGISVTRVAVVTGCIPDNVCDVNPCPANAYCLDVWNAYECPCLAGWQGEGCTQSVDDCSNHRCVNGATCLDIFQVLLCWVDHFLSGIIKG